MTKTATPQEWKVGRRPARTRQTHRFAKPTCQKPECCPQWKRKARLRCLKGPPLEEVRGQGASRDLELCWCVSRGRFIGFCGHRIETPFGFWRQKAIIRKGVSEVESRADFPWRFTEPETNRCLLCPYFSLWPIGFAFLKILTNLFLNPQWLGLPAQAWAGQHPAKEKGRDSKPSAVNSCWKAEGHLIQWCQHS